MTVPAVMFGRSPSAAQYHPVLVISYPSSLVDVRLAALRNYRLLCPIAVALLAPAPARAQSSTPVAFVLLGGEAEERLRLDQLVRRRTPRGWLLRAPSRFLEWPVEDSTLSARVLTPDVRVTVHSALPVAANDGPLRASRGVNGLVTAGAMLTYGGVRVVLAPQLVAEQNLPFQVIQYPQGDGAPRSVWANPFHPLPESIDLPQRFGDGSHRRLTAGQSSVMVRAGRSELGIATENVWWGPGVRNALVLSNNAGGFPHLVARSAEPLGTRIGSFEYDALAGRVSESEYFDADASNDQRTLLGGAVAWTPTGATGFQLGVSRLRLSGNDGHDQMSSVFGRWVFPVAGFEMYAEWARFEDPASVRDFLEYPSHSQGYTLGFQWARTLAAERTFRLQGEASYLEPSASLRVRPVMTSYTSRTVPQGFTHNGEVLGAGIGPGSSGQWLAGDLFVRSWRVGVFAARTRYDNGVLYEPIVPGFKLQDVSLTGGVRASTEYRGMLLSLELMDAARLNYLYQAYIEDPIATTSGGVDIANRTLSLVLSTAPRR